MNQTKELTQSKNATIQQIVKKIISEGHVCNNCLGRQFANLSTGFTNKERGQAIKLFILMENDANFKIKHISNKKNDIQEYDLIGKDEVCWICLNLFETLDEWTDKIVQELEGIEYSTFLVGTKLSGLLSENEEIVWSESHTPFAEPLKSELNREVGKLISKKTKKVVDFNQPDIVVILDLGDEKVTIQIRSVYIYGRYKKYIRGIPQTRWPCRKCRGSGCDTCNFTGKQYKESVDELISKEVIKFTNCIDTKFHGAGREDIDALMLGEGRPFIIEAVNPIIRTFNVKDLENAINSFANGKVEVIDLEFTKREKVEILKTTKASKAYKLKVIFDEKVEEDLLKLKVESLSCTEIKQKTPTRVLHRRADLIRKRTVQKAKLIEYCEEYATIEVYCDGGLYVKELISGDEKRTNPSLTALIGINAKVLDLDVITVDL